MNKFLTSTLFALLLPASFVFSQANYTFPVNVWQAIQNQQVTVTHSQTDIGSTADIFDGNFSTVARSAAINPMVVTLVFDYTINVTSMSTRQTEGHGWWTVESANSLADLDNHSGSYQVLFSQSPLTQAVTVTIPVVASKKAFRLTMQRTTGDNYVHLQEWGIAATASVQISDLCFKPNQVRMIKNANYQMKLAGMDAAGNSYPLASGVAWASSNSSIATVNSSGLMNSFSSLGETTLTGSWSGLSKSTNVKIVADFTMPLAPQRTVKVALVIIDPLIPAAGGQRFSQVHWNSWWGSPYNFETLSGGTPKQLANKVRDSLTAVSGGVATYQFVETHDEQNLMFTLGGTALTVDSMYHLFQEPGWTTFHLVAEQQGQSVFQYNELLDKYDFCTKSNNHQIDEVWVYAMPFIGMWEANMTGTGAFWINGAVVSGNSCTDLLPIMGMNYERSYDLALHNFGHRIETTMYKTFGTSVRYADYDPPYPPGVPKNTLQKFMSYEMSEPGDSHVGNVHFPPNAIENYGYYNTGSVTTYEQNWKRYPFLFQQSRSINCSDWNCDHDGFMRWWLRRLPKFKCKDQSGFLNNWWLYVIDYNEGKAMEQQLSGCNCEIFAESPPAPANYCQSYSNYPWEEWIAKVQVGNFNNASGKIPYSDFTSLNTNLSTGSTPIELTTGFSYFTWDEYWRVWIDLNHDGDFTDAGEKVFEGIKTKPANGTVTSTLTGNINVSATALTGATRMRVSMKRGAYGNSCETLPFGEVEDYTVNINAGPVPKPDLTNVGWEVIPGGSNYCFTAPGSPYGFLGGLVLNTTQITVSSPFVAKAWLSKDDIISANDLLWQTLNYSGIGAGGTAGLNINTAVPASTPPGVYNILVKVDAGNAIDEADETNNIFNTGPQQIGSPDFVPQNLTGVPASVAVGSSLSFSVKLKDLGNFPLSELSGNMAVSVALSVNNLYGGFDDVSLVTETVNFSQFSAGIATLNISAQVPATVAPGNYYLVLRVNAQCETNNLNNDLAGPLLAIISGGTPGTYCASASNFPWEDWIASVKINDLDNPSAKSPYSDFTSKTIHVKQGLQYVVTLTAGYSYFTYDEYWKIWIDFNQNGVFENDDEVLFSIQHRPGNGTLNASISQTLVIPTNIPTGTTRMRVSMQRDNYPGPCGTLSFGEVEDYTVDIQAAASNLPNLFPSYNGILFSGTAGQTLNGGFAVLNNGTTAVSGTWSVGWFFSYDNALGPEDELIGSASLSNTPVGVTPVMPVSVTVPAWAVPGTYYLFMVVDKDNQVQEINEFDNAASSQFIVPGGGGSYCPSSSAFPWHEWISSVKINDVEMISDKSTYSDFTGTTFILDKNSSQNTVKFTGTFSYFTYREYWKAWVDFNHNGIFEESERLFEGYDSNVPPPGSNAVQSISGEVGPFPNALTGPTRMRVSMKRFSAAAPCEELPFGEVEDYTVMVTDNFGNTLQDRAEDLSFEAAFEQTAVRLFGAFYVPQPVEEVRFEKSIDGENFYPLEIQPGKGQPDAAQVVQTLDKQPEEGLNYYRLALTLGNGNLRQSHVRIVSFGSIPDFTIFPNPANDEIFIQPSRKIDSEVRWSIYNTHGQLIFEEEIAELSSEPHRIAVEKLQEGMYYLHILRKGKRAMGRRFVIVR